MKKKVIVACGGAVATSTIAANAIVELAKENIKFHDKNSPLLLENIKKTDKITQSKPISLIRDYNLQKENQIRLF